ncbi:MAG: Na/Pi cotransporter family protein [Planctomycetes bacterium]|nr:Na/Pi cotransporter family protein [Planctomycetota bacterium]
MNLDTNKHDLSHDPLANPPGKGGAWWKYVALLVLLFGFLIAIKMLSKGISGFGSEFTEGLLAGVENPFAGLAAGILFTVLVQSSSVTTATIVALVGAGTLTVGAAVPMVMGANIGTTITNTLVSIGHVRRGSEFQRAFAAATVHDFFNLMVVGIMFAIEQGTGFLEKSARSIAETLTIGGGGSYKSPIKAAVSSGEKFIASIFEWCGLDGSGLATAKLVCGIALIFLCLTTITKIMKKVIAHKAERAMNQALKKSAFFAIAIGAAITMAVQSSSITTSLIVPMCGSGILSIEAAFPVMLGANIGTTITAFLASLATGKAGLIIALVHVLFNMIGTIAIMVIPRARQIPIALAEGLAVRAVQNKIWVIAYVFIMFIIIPLLGILIF